MSEFENLDSILELEFSGDPWNDDACLLAIDILNRFTPEDWATLTSTWSGKKESWKALLADAISGAPADKSLGILLTMIDSEGDLVAEAAVLTLNGLIDLIDPHALTVRQKRRIVETAEKSAFNKAIMGAFSQKIQSG